jgi:hypothetical protein
MGSTKEKIQQGENNCTTCLDQDDTDVIADDIPNHKTASLG